MAGLLVRGTDRALLATGRRRRASWSRCSTPGPRCRCPGDPQSLLPSMTIADPGRRWPRGPSSGSAWACSSRPFGVFAAVALGARAARRRLLDEPERHRRCCAGWPWPGSRRGAGRAAAGPDHRRSCGPRRRCRCCCWPARCTRCPATPAGWATRRCSGCWPSGSRERGGPGPVARAVQACGQRSLSCYLAQSVAFVALLPAWTLGLGAHARLWQAALVGLGAWLVILLIAAAVRPGRVPGPGRGAAAPADLRPVPRGRAGLSGGRCRKPGTAA